MVDFRKHLVGTKRSKPTDPIALYESLDRAHDKGPLRPAQAAVLTKWFQDHQSKRDVIVKLHTGQGKTLIGLVMLQSKLNAENGPCAYLCPNNFLIEQTCEQAKQFGITTCQADGDLPNDFLNGKAILVTSVQKMFNGLTKFGLDRKSIKLGALLLDDAHACADDIRDACRIRIPRLEPAYAALKAMFETELEAQGMGTYADIVNEKRDAFLPVPYWAWLQKEGDVARVLSKYEGILPIKFPWPLLKDILAQCNCVISGASLEIESSVAPLNKFGSYWSADHRIFMSATVTDDAFLVKGLQLSPEVIANPLSYEKETWSGEKMVLLPSLIHDDLDRQKIVSMFAAPSTKKFGQVALAPSFPRTADWKTLGARIATRETVFDEIPRIKAGNFTETLVLVNRYDGIDLPDETCRILIFDSKPYTENLNDLYQELCRPDSESILMQCARTIEQGMGRSVRGEKDYSVIIFIGADVVKLVRDKASRKFFSTQMDTQVQIGLEIAEMARGDVLGSHSPTDALIGLIRQCLSRDEGWKEFYLEKMKTVVPRRSDERLLRLHAAELEAERAFATSNYTKAVSVLQHVLDSSMAQETDRGWYLQEMARYAYRIDRNQSQTLQEAAHKANRMLLKPTTGVSVAALVLSQARVSRLIAFIKSFGNYSDLDVGISDILSNLTFGTRAEKFELALHQLGQALGFASERPDKEWKKGPDNLWALNDHQYILWECKDEVDVLRTDISKSEAEQMISSSAWFKKHYAGKEVKRLLVHPADVGSASAPFIDEVEAVRPTELKRLVAAVRYFFRSFKLLDFNDLTEIKVQALITDSKLTVDDLYTKYSKKIKDGR